MSADNWAVCPQCKARADADKKARQARAEEGYGKVDRREYARLVADAERIVAPKCTLREDHELGVTEDADLFVIYGCDCTECGFSHRFEHKEKLTVNDKANVAKGKRA